MPCIRFHWQVWNNKQANLRELQNDGAQIISYIIASTRSATVPVRLVTLPTALTEILLTSGNPNWQVLSMQMMVCWSSRLYRAILLGNINPQKACEKAIKAVLPSIDEHINNC